MRATNKVLTILLACAAALAWCGTVFSYQLGWFTYPTVQVPFCITLSAAASLGWVLLHLSEKRDNETRCRKCRYILRGLSEPRCPECGERI